MCSDTCTLDAIAQSYHKVSISQRWCGQAYGTAKKSGQGRVRVGGAPAHVPCNTAGSRRARPRTAPPLSAHCTLGTPIARCLPSVRGEEPPKQQACQARSMLAEARRAACFVPRCQPFPRQACTHSERAALSAPVLAFQELLGQLVHQRQLPRLRLEQQAAYALTYCSRSLQRLIPCQPLLEVSIGRAQRPAQSQRTAYPMFTVQPGNAGSFSCIPGPPVKEHKEKQRMLPEMSHHRATSYT